MADLLSVLNEEQRKAVEHFEGYVRLHAGAGTGKTRTLTYRYAYLVSVLGIPPRSVWCCTFTNKAASEMKSRITALCEDVGEPFVSTFHSFCVAFLKEEIMAIGWPNKFTIWDINSVKSALRPIYTECGINGRELPLKKAWEHIDSNKALKDYLPYFIDPDSSKLLELSDNASSMENKIFWRYLFAQRTSFALDFDDLILVSLYILKNFPEVRARWQDRLEYIMVDEFQDIDRYQYELVEILAGKHHNLFIVGDPDQTIYSWRGARVNYFNDFIRVHGGVEQHIDILAAEATALTLETESNLAKQEGVFQSNDQAYEAVTQAKGEHIHKELDSSYSDTSALIAKVKISPDATQAFVGTQDIASNTWHDAELKPNSNKAPQAQAGSAYKTVSASEFLASQAQANASYQSPAEQGANSGKRFSFKAFKQQNFNQSPIQDLGVESNLALKQDTHKASDRVKFNQRMGSDEQSSYVPIATMQSEDSRVKLQESGLSKPQESSVAKRNNSKVSQRQESGFVQRYESEVALHHENGWGRHDDQDVVTHNESSAESEYAPFYVQNQSEQFYAQSQQSQSKFNVQGQSEQFSAQANQAYFYGQGQQPQAKEAWADETWGDKAWGDESWSDYAPFAAQQNEIPSEGGRVKRHVSGLAKRNNSKVSQRYESEVAQRQETGVSLHHESGVSQCYESGVAQHHENGWVRHDEQEVVTHNEPNAVSEQVSTISEQYNERTYNLGDQANQANQAIALIQRGKRINENTEAIKYNSSDARVSYYQRKFGSKIVAVDLSAYSVNVQQYEQEQAWFREGEAYNLVAGPAHVDTMARYEQDLASDMSYTDSSNMHMQAVYNKEAVERSALDMRNTSLGSPESSHALESTQISDDNLTNVAVSSKTKVRLDSKKLLAAVANLQFTIQTDSEDASEANTAQQDSSVTGKSLSKKSTVQGKELKTQAKSKQKTSIDMSSESNVATDKASLEQDKASLILDKAVTGPKVLNLRKKTKVESLPDALSDNSLVEASTEKDSISSVSDSKNLTQAKSKVKVTRRKAKAEAVLESDELFESKAKTLSESDALSESIADSKALSERMVKAVVGAGADNSMSLEQDSFEQNSHGEDMHEADSHEQNRVEQDRHDSSALIKANSRLRTKAQRTKQSLDSASDSNATDAQDQLRYFSLDEPKEDNLTASKASAVQSGALFSSNMGQAISFKDFKQITPSAQPKFAHALARGNTTSKQTEALADDGRATKGIVQGEVTNHVALTDKTTLGNAKEAKPSAQTTSSSFINFWQNQQDKSSQKQGEINAWLSKNAMTIQGTTQKKIKYHNVKSALEKSGLPLVDGDVLWGNDESDS